MDEVSLSDTWRQAGRFRDPRNFLPSFIQFGTFTTDTSVTWLVVWRFAIGTGTFRGEGTIEIGGKAPILCNVETM